MLKNELAKVHKLHRKATYNRLSPNSTPMILIKTAADLNQYLTGKQLTGKTIGLVPTMGALHKGHLGLIEYSNKKTNITVASIFVNPTQFNDPNDYARYPVTLENDLFLLEKAGCDIVFLPSVTEMYPNGLNSSHTYDLGYLENILEGKYRPGHFQGVCRVVDTLLRIVQPNQLFLGQKDYQQCMVIKKLIQLLDLPTRLEIIPTIREESGLAMSSRNMRLSDQDKISAAAIYQSMVFIREHLTQGLAKNWIIEATALLTHAGFEKIDYVSIADADNLTEIVTWDGKTSVVVLVAAFIGGVRLIDNLRIA